MNFLQDIRRNNKYSGGHIRYLYAELLRCIDVNSLELSPRGEIDPLDENNRSNLHLLSSFSSVLPRRYSQSSDTERADEHTVLQQQELAVALRILAATRSGDKEGVDQDIALRNEASEQATRLAGKLEKRVVQIIRQIGEAVVNSSSGQPKENARSDLRDDETFAYFCEKAILALLVVIARDNPEGFLNERTEGKKSNCCFHGVVWSARVKAQVLQTVGLLISGAKNASNLHYLLSQHCINQLVLSVLPLNQWTDPAMEVILPAYADLLKALSLQLGGSPDLFPLFTINHEGNKGVTSFPLFSALVEMTTSTYTQSDSYVYATCLNLIMGLLRISDPSVRQWICQSEREQRVFCNHIANRLRERYRRISNLTTGPVVDSVRSNALCGQLLALNDQIGAVNDIFWCNIDILSVRFCEILLQRFVAVLLQDFLPGDVRNFLGDTGVSDYDVIPDLEATAQASSVVLSHLVQHLEYGPLLRMVYVAFLHPRTPKVLEKWKLSSKDDTREYVLTPSLNATVQSKDSDTVSNPYRQCVMKALAGEFGGWRVTSAAMLLENVLTAIDTKTLVDLKILPAALDDPQQTPTDLEDSLVAFLEREHCCDSNVSTAALECVSSLALQYLHQVLAALTNRQGTTESQRSLFKYRLVSALHSTKTYFFEKTLESQSAIQVNDIFVDVVEAEAKSRYKRFSRTENDVQSRGFAYHLPNGCCGAEPLVRRLRGVDLNDVETTRFYARMAIHFRAVCNVTEKMVVTNERITPERPNESFSVNHWVDKAGELSSMFACLMEKPPVGTDLDLHGRMVFPFVVQANEKRLVNEDDNLDTSELKRTFSEDMMLRKSAELILVMDPTDMFIVKPFPRKEVNRGTIICSIPLLDVVAAAADNERLHVAVRHHNVGFLIKNGNMLLTFDTSGTCLIVARYLERCRSLLRKELYDKIITLFSQEESRPVEDTEKQTAESAATAPADVEIPHVKTY